MLTYSSYYLSKLKLSKWIPSNAPNSTISMIKICLESSTMILRRFVAGSKKKKILKKGNIQDQFVRDTLKLAKENALLKSLPRSEMKG